MLVIVDCALFAQAESAGITRLNLEGRSEIEADNCNEE